MIVAPAGKYIDQVGAYLMEKIPGLRLEAGGFVAFMIVDDNRDFVGGVAYSNFRAYDGQPLDVEISCAAEHPAAFRPTVCRAVFEYAFEQVGVVRVTAITAKGNKKARDFLQSLGFQLEGNARLGYDGRRDALIYGLLRSECRFLALDEEANDGEEQPEAPAGTGPGSDGPSAGSGEPGSGDHSSEPEPD